MGNENDSREAYQARVSALGRAYADALLSADEGAAEIAIREAMEAGLDTAQIDDEIIAPALWHVGDLWQHVIALRMVDNLLRNAGYDVAMLGSDVPTEALAR
jgi:methanogenic corrinoid protein MtbC1